MTELVLAAIKAPARGLTTKEGDVTTQELREGCGSEGRVEQGPWEFAGFPWTEPEGRPPGSVKAARVHAVPLNGSEDTLWAVQVSIKCPCCHKALGASSK